MPTPRNSQRTPGVPGRLARFAWIAATFHGKRWDKLKAWSREELGVELDKKSVLPHLNDLRPPSAAGRPPKGASSRSAPSEEAQRTAIMRDWWVVDEDRLGLTKVLFRIPGRFDQREALREALDRMAGIRQHMEVARTYEVLAVALVRSASERDELRARIQEHVAWGNVEFDELSAESTVPTPLTWLDLARREAEHHPDRIDR